MNNQNWQLSEGDQFAPAAPDSMEHLPSHHTHVAHQPVITATTSRLHFQSMRIGELESEIVRLEKSLKWEENYASRIGTHGPGCHMWGPSHYVCAMNKLAEVSKGPSMYEHVRTLNPHRFSEIWLENIELHIPFDDLVLADMDKRMKEKSQ
jgi:hypothetical protein